MTGAAPGTADPVALEPAPGAPAADGDDGTGIGTGGCDVALVHEPALDGLRGLAVAAVVVFHLGHLEGGFLGVDLFFVLSGYLITSLLVVEHGRRGRIDLRRFWSRRARRLLPALFVFLVGVAVLMTELSSAGERARARGDALATLGYVANWHRAFADLGYWDIFASPSPLDHMWSLAIEEQFYLVWPLVVLVVVRRWGARALGWLAAAGAATSFVLLALHHSPADTNRAYYGTDSRVGPMLLGAALAVVAARRPRRPAPPGTAVELAAALALVVMAASFTWVDGQEGWYYHGGLVVFALASTAVIAAVAGGPPGPVARILSVRPLAALGLVSYGVYLWHWPLILYLTPARVGVDGWRLAVVQVGATLAVSIVSFVAVERPIRRRALAGPPLRLAAAGGVAVTLAAVLIATSGRAETVVAGGRVPVDGSDNPVLLYPDGGPAEPSRILLVGDSGVYYLGPPLRDAAAELGITVATSSQITCAVIVPDGLVRGRSGKVYEFGEPCQDDRRELWSELVESFDPDVVIYYLANAGRASEIRVDGVWSADCDPVFDGYLYEALREDAALLQAGGAHLVVTTTPDPLVADAERVDCRNRSYRDVVDSLDDATLVDLDTFVWDHQNAGRGMFLDIVHLSPEGAELTSEWLLAELAPHLETDEPRVGRAGGAPLR